MPIKIFGKLVKGFFSTGGIIDARDVEVDATGFDGNLDQNDVNVQMLAQKVDDLQTGSGGGTDDQTAAEVSQSSSNQSGLINSSATVQVALDRVDATGLGAPIITFTGSFTARDSNLDDWFRNRATVVMEHTAGGTNAIRTFTLPDIDALNAIFDVLQTRGVGEVFTITIGYQGGSTRFINRNALRIQAPSVSALFDRNEIPTTIAQGNSVTFRIERIGSNISAWERISTQATPSSVDAFGELQFQTVAWNNAPSTFLPSSTAVQKGYAFRVFGSNPDNGSVRAGLITSGDTNKVMYNGDWVVWIADSFDTWQNGDNWFVLAADDVRRITQNAANFLQHVTETDERQDVGLAQFSGANDALVWLSPVVMQRAPFLDPNTDGGGAPDGNPRPNAGGIRYVGGRFDVNQQGYFQFGGNRFNNYLYLGITPSYVTAQGAANIDIVVRDVDGDELQRLNLATHFTQVDDATFSNSTVNHYIYNTSGDPNGATTFNYGSLMEIGIVLTQTVPHFTFDRSFDATPNVMNLQESQLSQDVQNLLERIKDFRQGITSFDSILDRISPYEDITHNEPYVDARFDTVPSTGAFPTNIGAMDAVSASNPRYTLGAGTSVFIAVQGGSDRLYMLYNITQDTLTPLQDSSTVSLGSSQQFNGVTYFIYRVDGIATNDVLEIQRTTVEQVVKWANDILKLSAQIEAVQAKLNHAVLDLPAPIVDWLDNEVTINEETTPTIVATEFNNGLGNGSGQTVFYENNPNTFSSGSLNSKSINENNGNDRYRNKLVYLPNEAFQNQTYVTAFNGSSSTDLISYRNGSWFAHVFVPATAASTVQDTIYPAQASRVSGAGIWQTIEAVTFVNGVPVPEADEIFFTRNVPADSVAITVQYRGHANGNVFGAGSVMLQANQTAVSVTLNDGSEAVTLEIRRFANGQIRASITEQVHQGLPTINDVQVILSYQETRIIPATAATTREVEIERFHNDGFQVFAIKPSINDNLIIVGEELEIDTGYSYTDLFGATEAGFLTMTANGTFLDYEDIEPINTTVQTLQNHSSLTQFGLFSTQYTHATIVELGTQLIVRDSTGNRYNVGDALNALGATAL